jgi:mannose-6-phosphate isomerase-like protein (cupin superfamily)
MSISITGKGIPTVLAKVAVRRLAIYTPPLTAPLTEGGRITTAAGEIAQLVSGEEFRYLAYLEFLHKPDVARGNHYHLHKTESLYVLHGRLRTVFKDIETDEMQTVELQPGDIATIQPGCAHVFVPLEYTHALEFSPQPFDPDDTYRYMLEPAA